jgi:hypothetical protein
MANEEEYPTKPDEYPTQSEADSTPLPQEFTFRAGEANRLEDVRQEMDESRAVDESGAKEKVTKESPADVPTKETPPDK